MHGVVFWGYVGLCVRKDKTFHSYVINVDRNKIWETSGLPY